MAKMSITEAARQAGITRQYMHKLIKAGTVTAATDEAGNRYIDDAELLRAFDGRLPKIKPPSTNDTLVDSKELRLITPEKTSLITGLRVEVQLLRERLEDKAEQIRKAEERERVEVQQLREQLRKTEEREQRLLDQVDKLTDTIKQIEHKPQPEPAAPEPHQNQPKRGFWGRVFRGAK